jgi:3-phenylpropionate/cinnamic acid dioxygenase small subunit
MMDELPNPVSDGVYLAIQRFLYREAALLDAHLYGDWFALLAPGIEYRITVPSAREADAGPVRVDIVIEDHAALKTRVEQLGNPRLTRAENPRTVMRRSVTNIEAFELNSGTLLVKSHLMAFRGSRTANASAGFYSADRKDILSIGENGFLILEREVSLDNAVLEGGILSTLL